MTIHDVHDSDDDVANPADEAAVRGLYERLTDGWNRDSADAFAAAFAEDGDLIAFDGTTSGVAGRSFRFTRSFSTGG